MFLQPFCLEQLSQVWAPCARKVGDFREQLATYEEAEWAPTARNPGYPKVNTWCTFQAADLKATQPTRPSICFLQADADLLHQTRCNFLLVSPGCPSTWLGSHLFLRFQTHPPLLTLLQCPLPLKFISNLAVSTTLLAPQTLCPTGSLSHGAFLLLWPPLKWPLSVILSL